MATCVLRIIAGYHQESSCGHESSWKKCQFLKADIFQSFSDQSPTSRPTLRMTQSGGSSWLLCLCLAPLSSRCFGRSLEDTEPFKISLGQSQCFRVETGTLGVPVLERQEGGKRGGSHTALLESPLWVWVNIANFFFLTFLHIRM